MSDDTNYDDIEDRAEDRLSYTGADTDLGKRMARDARRVAGDEMSREEFERKYADEVEDEFGVDLTDNPRADEEPQPGVPPTSSGASRRGMLKAAGAVAIGTAVAGAGGSFAGQQISGGAGTASAQEGSDVQRGMVLDTEKCIKCLRCVQACKEENNTPEGHFWMEVFRYQRDDEQYEDPTDCESIQRPCQHCDDAPCLEVCPNNSRFKSEEGRTLCDYDTCLGCAYCEVACPYHVNAFVHTETPDYLENPEESEDFEPILEGTDGEFDGAKRDENDRWVSGAPPEGSCSKCTFCAHREQDDELRGTTACEDVCPVDAIHFGDMNDPESDPNQYLEQFDDDETFKLQDDISDPNVIYVGDDPSEDEVTEVPGPTTHEDRGLEEVDPSH
jgi:molybdopterin-containing oxidoreductase family iron-sulfur binding subunit